MQIESIDIIDYPASKVYPFMRDKIECLVPFLPSVESIKSVEREQISKNRVKILNYWKTKPDTLPSMVKNLLKPEIFTFKDFALWKDEEYCVDFTLETFWLSGIYECKGTNYFLPYNNGTQTEVKVTFSLNIYPEKIPGVPTFLAKKLLPLVESVIKKVITPNMTSLSTGLKGYLSKNKI